MRCASFVVGFLRTQNWPGPGFQRSTLSRKKGVSVSLQNIKHTQDDHPPFPRKYLCSELFLHQAKLTKKEKQKILRQISRLRWDPIVESPWLGLHFGQQNDDYDDSNRSYFPWYCNIRLKKKGRTNIEFIFHWWTSYVFMPVASHSYHILNQTKFWSEDPGHRQARMWNKGNHNETLKPAPLVRWISSCACYESTFKVRIFSKDRSHGPNKLNSTKQGAMSNRCLFLVKRTVEQLEIDDKAVWAWEFSGDL